MNTCVRFKVKGRVQGVGFRWFIYQKATDLGVTGYVRNLPDGAVEIEVEGAEEQVERLLDYARRGPAFSNVTHVDLQRREYGAKYKDFQITY
ncbi:MAG: acylphosphatase [bacterium]